MSIWITLDDYLGPWKGHADATPEVCLNADALLDKVNAALEKAFVEGVDFQVNPKTKSYISGEKYGGFRPQYCAQGSPTSSHKVGKGIDIYDPDGALDAWLTDATLKQFNLYREHPDDTSTWCHLTDRAPGSGKRTFKP